MLRGGATGSRLQREANATGGDVGFFHGRNVEDGMFFRTDTKHLWLKNVVFFIISD